MVVCGGECAFVVASGGESVFFCGLFVAASGVWGVSVGALGVCCARLCTALCSHSMDDRIRLRAARHAVQCCRHHGWRACWGADPASVACVLPHAAGNVPACGPCVLPRVCCPGPVVLQEDMPNLPYLQACVKETLRFMPSGGGKARALLARGASHVGCRGALDACGAACAHPLLHAVCGVWTV